MNSANQKFQKASIIFLYFGLILSFPASAQGEKNIIDQDLVWMRYSAKMNLNQNPLC